jgi:hypothetical protein
VLRADPILLQDSRYVSTQVSIEPGVWLTEERTPAAAFAAFDVNLTSIATSAAGTARATAEQHSVLTRTRFVGRGRTENTAAAAADVVSSGAVSLFAATFNLSTPHAFRYSGAFQRSETGFVEFEIAFAGEGTLGEGSELGTHGVLGRGEHDFYIWLLTAADGFPSERAGYASGSYDVELSLHPVPEPASFALLATGLASLAAWRQRRCPSCGRRVLRSRG